MTNTAVDDFLIDYLVRIYGKPKTDGLIVELRRACARFTPEQLSLGARTIVDTSEYHRWPTVAQAIKACSGARTSAAPKSERAPDYFHCRAYRDPNCD